MKANPSPRNTFGIIDPITKKRYEDIIGSHLQLRRLLLEEWLLDKTIAETRDRQKDYTILLDHTTQKELIKCGIVDVIVSFQHRKDGCYAVCRLWDEQKTTRKTLLNTDTDIIKGVIA